MSHQFFGLIVTARDGATHKQVIDAVGMPHADKRAELIEAGKVSETRAKRDGVIAYTLSLPTKGRTKAATAATRGCKCKAKATSKRQGMTQVSA